MRLWMAMTAALCLAASGAAQLLQTKSYDTSGHPTQAIWSPDGQYVLVTVTRDMGGSGIEIFRDEKGKLKHVAWQPLKGSMSAQGILLIPHTQILAVGVSNAGVAFLPLADTLEGKAKAKVMPQGDKAGSGYLAVTPDGQTLFVANEYGDAGNVGVIALHRDAAGEIHPEALAHLPTRQATPGVTVSPDGSRVYAVGEVISSVAAAALPGHGNKDLERAACRQAIEGPLMPNGVLYVIDEAKAAALAADAPGPAMHAAEPVAVDAGCSPVRIAETADSKTLYVTARGDNQVLVFDAQALEHDPDHAFLRAIPTGNAPVGLALFDGDRKLLVANSSRFSGGFGEAVVIDLTDPANPKKVQTIRTGEFPRNITVSPDGKSLLMTVYLADQFMVLNMK